MTPRERLEPPRRSGTSGEFKETVARRWHPEHVAKDITGSFVSACDNYLDQQDTFLNQLVTEGALSPESAAGLRARLDQLSAAMRCTREALQASADPGRRPA